LKQRSGHPIRTWLQGSYKFGTQVRPVRKDDEFDIDLGVYFQWSGTAESGRHSTQTLKSFVQDSLNVYERSDTEDVLEVCPPKTRCGRIRYRNDFHIDVPAYHLDRGEDARTLATSANWEASDPKPYTYGFAINSTVRLATRFAATSDISKLGLRLNSQKL
jgi:hypothetical protein